MYKRNPGKGKNKGNEMEIKTKRLILRSIRIGDEKRGTCLIHSRIGYLGEQPDLYRVSAFLIS